VIKIAISQAAFEAITETMPLGSVSVGHENESNERGERLVWLDRAVVTGSGRCAGRARATATSSCDWRRRANGSQKSPALLGAAARAESARRDCQRSIVSFDWPFDNLGFLSENFR